MAKNTWTNTAGGLWQTGANWSGGLPTSADDVSIVVPGSYTVTLSSPASANSVLLNDASGTLVLASLLNVAGTVALNAGSLTLNQSGTLANATLMLNGGTLVTNDGTLSGGTVDGTLNIGMSGSYLDFTNNTQFFDSTGLLPGTINLVHSNTTLYACGSNSLDNVAVNLSGGTTLYAYDNQNGHSVLTLGPNATVTQTGSYSALTMGYAVGDGIVNQGQIALVQSGGSATVTGASFTNAASLVMSGESVSIAAFAMTNTGSIGVTGGTLTVSGNWTNAGTITATNAVLALGGTTDFASLANISTTGGTLYLTGSVNGTGATLAYGSGTPLGQVTLNYQAVIHGGTLQDAGAGMVFDSGTLDGVKYNGVMDLSANVSRVVFANNTAVFDATGTLPGLIKDTGASSTVWLNGSGTLDAASILLGSAGNTSYISDSPTLPAGNTLTLGAALSVTHVGKWASLTSGYGASDALIDQGTISAALAGGYFTMGGHQFINQGTIAVANGDTVVVNVSIFNNSGSISVTTGGTLWLASGGGTWSNGGSITGNAGFIVLYGTGNAAGLGTLTNTGGTVTFAGSFDLQGTTLPIGAGTSLGQTALYYSGLLHGGTLLDAGGSGMLMQGGTLDAMTYAGTMNLAETVARVNFSHTLTLTDATETLPGVANITGNSAGLTALAGGTLGDASLDSAIVNLGNVFNSASLAESDIASAGNARLLLGSNLTVNHIGVYASIQAGYQTNDLVSNAGSISALFADGQFSVVGFGFANTGSIAVGNSDSFSIGTTTFANSGTMSVAGGGTLRIGGAWSNTGLIQSTNGNLTLGGASSFAAMGTVNRTGGTVTLAGILQGGGGTLSFGAGTAIGQLTQANTSLVQNGTLIDQGGSGGMVFHGGTFDTIAYRGTMDMSTSSAVLTFVNSLTATDLSGSNPGTILLTGSLAGLYGFNNAVLDNAAVQIGNVDGAILASTDGNGGHSQLTLGSGLTVTHAGHTAYLNAGYAAGDGVLNQGQIVAGLPGVFSINGHAFTNDSLGSVAVSNTDLLQVVTQTFTNLGAMSVADGGTLKLNTAWNNLGTIGVSAGTLILGGTGSFAQIGTVNRTGGTILVTGSIDGTGATLAIGAGTALGALTLQANGVIHNGTLLDSGSGLIASSGTLNSVTYRGGLDMSTPFANLNIVNGITFSNLGNTGSGSIALTGTGGILYDYGTTTLDTVAVTIGSTQGDTIATWDGAASQATLTLGPNVQIQQTGASATLHTSGGNDRIINQGCIVTGGTATQFMVNGPGSFANQGYLGVAAGGSLTLAAIAFANVAAGVLTGGTYAIGAGATMQLANNLPVTSDAADLTLSGAGSMLQWYAQATSTQTSVESSLSTIAATGALRVLGGRNYTAAVAFADKGVLQLGGGTFALAATATGMTVSGSGTLNGYGTVTFGAGRPGLALTDNGLIEANGGRLAIMQPVSGSGNLQIDAGATLELGGAAQAAITAAFNGGGTLLLDKPSSFLGTIAGFGAGELIDLAGVAATGAAIAGSTLTVALPGNGTLTYALSGATSTGALRVAADGHGGTLVTGYQLAIAAAHAPEPVVLGHVHVGDADSTALTLGNIVATGTASESLNASFGGTTGAATASGAMADLAPGSIDSTSLIVGLNTATDGLLSGTATLALASDGTPVPGDGYGPVGIGTQVVAVSGAVYALAAPMLNGPSLNLGSARVGDPAVSGQVLVGNGTAADAYQESLTYTVEQPLPSGIGLTSGGSGLVASGSAGAITLTGPSGTSGIWSGPVVVDLTSTGTGTSGLADTVLASQTIAVSATLYAPAAVNLLTTSVNFGNVHAGTITAGSVNLQNIGSGALVDTLTGGFGAVSAPFASAGTFGAGLASGASGSLGVSFAPSTGGPYSGTAALALTSHDSDLPDLPLAAGPVTLTGTAWNYASPVLSTTVLNFGATRVGATPLQQMLTIGNGLTVDAYQENLRFVATPPAGSYYKYKVIGSATGLLASGKSTALTLSLNTLYAGDYSGQILSLAMTSAGAGTSGLGLTPLSGASVTLNGKIYATAVPSPSAAGLVFHAHVGDMASQQVIIGNTAAGALTDVLTGGFGTVSGTWQGSGSLSVAASGQGMLSVAMTTSQEGAFTGSAAYALASHDSDQADATVTLAPLSLSGTVYSYAAPKLSATTMDFGATRVGGAVAAQSVTISDGTVADPYQEKLYFLVPQAPQGFNTSGADTGTIDPGTGGSIGLALNTAISGLYNNVAVPVAEWSSGLSGSGFGNTPLAGQSLQISGKVYAMAQAGLDQSQLPFGIVHVGQQVSGTLGITNTATGGLVDLLTGGWGTVTGGFTPQGSLGTGLASGASGVLTLNVDTSKAGQLTGTAALALSSHDSDLTDVSVGLPAINLNLLVYQYATGAFAKLSGAGAFSGSGTNYTLALGTVAFGSAALTANLGVLNGAIANGFADQLTGTVSSAGDAAFMVSGLNSFSNLSAQQIGVQPVITFNTGVAGTYQEKLVITGTGTDARYSGAIQAVTLTVTGTVAAQQTVWNLTSAPVTIQAGPSNDTFNAHNGALSAGQNIDGGGGTNQLVLLGAGQFDLRAPTTLTNIQSVTATEGQYGYTPQGGAHIPAQNQIVYLRDGLDQTITVQPDPSINASNPNAPTIAIFGANNHDIINLATGNDTVTLGSSLETVNGGGGNNTFNVTAATIGATLNGGTGNTTLAVSGGGSLAMGSNIAQITAVTLGLTAGAPAYAFTANGIAGLTITDMTAGTNTIVLGSASQVVNFNGAHDTVRATAAFASALFKNAGSGCSLEITTGGTVVMNTAAWVQTVKLDQATKLTMSKIIGEKAIGSSGADSIVATTQGQILTGGGGGDILTASTLHGDIFRDMTANLNGTTIKGFGGGLGGADSIDFTDLAYNGTVKETFSVGKLNVYQGTHLAASVTMGGALSTAHFLAASDGTGGTKFTYH